MNTSLIRKCLIAYMVVSSLAAGLYAQSSQVIVRVVEDVTNATLEGATVRIPELDIRSTTDRSGRSVINNVPVGQFTLNISYRGLPDYSEEFAVTEGEITALPVRMGASASGVEGEVYVLDEFVVTSDAISSEEIAQQIERNALNIKDVIASDTMGQMPDRTVADAVRRLPGITIEREGDNSENQYVSIRGMNADFNKVMIDGVSITVGNDDGASRSVPLNIISSSVADTIEVTKAATPDMDGDAIGGTVNIRTRSAFDYGDRYISAEATIGFSEGLDEYSSDVPVDNWFPSVDFLISDFFDDEGTLGYTFGANYRERVYVTSEVKSRGWERPTPADPYLPTAIRFEDKIRDIDEHGVFASIDWRPDADTRLAANYSYSHKETEITRNRLDYQFGTSSTILADDGENATELERDTFQRREASFFSEDQDVHVFKFLGEKQLNEWKVNGVFGFNFSKFAGDPDEDFTGRVETNSPQIVKYRRGSDPFEPIVSSSTFDAESDIDDYYYFTNGNKGTFEIEDTEYMLSGDAERELTLFGQAVTIKTGAKLRFRERDYEDMPNYYNGGFSLSAAEMDSIIADYNIDNRVGGNYGSSALLDPRAFRKLVDQLIRDGVLTQDPDDVFFEALGTYTVSEDIYAGYLQGTTEINKLTILAGIRLEYTDVEFDGSKVDFSNPPTPLSEDNAYLDILPGIHFRYDATDDLILRASLNKSLARASYSQLNPTEDIDADAAVGGGDIISRGDTDLDPTESWNLDLGLDYYYSNEGYVSLGVFAKFMENNIYRITSQPAFAGDDEVTEFRNADSAEVYGFEMAIDQGFGFIHESVRNFGFSANATILDAKVDTGLPGRDSDTPLFGQVDTAFNASLYYYGDRFRARISYNWSDDFLAFGGLSDDPNLDTYADAYGTFDLTAGYYITDNIELFFEAENLTDAANRGYDGSDDRLAYNSYKGTTYFIGLSWNL